jgi:hypothetical protein
MKVQAIKAKPTLSEAKFNKRTAFSRSNGYKDFNFALCVGCAYFSFDHSKEAVEWAWKYGCGKCRLAKSMDAYEGVMATAVCDKFLSRSGKDIKGKSASPKQLPDFVKLAKNEKGQYAVIFTA